ncbi:Leucyltransferase [Maricaulis maris MCS10]|uniref:Leucyl/phenylalanyl-tRNA--protein transferase n=1 Tax=Maricaulis maris (strain MCS10) TaxID=394221 RepID=LFTR_MARMM|nr:leucyl/phenylalanyl-tRNA--protein transferase [Maricaulis maris]Q0AQ81.1 RecName: Full=Leucyl/phenylalanyl-tRNA--protein transferase; AltName: Full=L/F-transferase; AltName: Full=Leucyltransferase; AltName: Full=Phenyalanyltransferase [Maricaulis maris MCS10]ABI65556.1 Leucyltransferase [Maricaulis maris MCS10]
MRGFGAEELLNCYARGVFPMAEGRDDPRIYLLDPDERGIIPLDQFHASRSLRKTVRQDVYQVTINQDFEAVVAGCAQSAPGREETWINESIIRLYSQLHDAGYAHSVECWSGADLVGGLYGVSLGAAFFGESMFSLRRDASKVALVHLIARLRAGGYSLLDTQFTTEHLESFGARTISRSDYRERLAEALIFEADFSALPDEITGAQALQSITQTS